MKIEIGIPKLWSLQASGRYSEVIVNSGLTDIDFRRLQLESWWILKDFNLQYTYCR
jgi:hypothetical protein